MVLFSFLLTNFASNCNLFVSIELPSSRFIRQIALRYRLAEIPGVDKNVVKMFSRLFGRTSKLPVCPPMDVRV